VLPKAENAPAESAQFAIHAAVARLIIGECFQPEGASRCREGQPCQKVELISLAAAGGLDSPIFRPARVETDKEAFDLLLPAADQFPRVWTVPYNLACYCALGAAG